MNPGDLLLLLLPLTFAGVCLIAHGWTWNGVGPALLATAGGSWYLWMQWLRHQSWLRHKDSDFILGTQHLAVAAWLGWSLAAFAAVGWAMLTLKELKP